MQHYGKKLAFRPKDKEIFRAALPKRVDFLEKNPELEATIAKHEPVFILINDTKEIHEKTQGTIQYKILLTGILVNGEKIAIVLEDIYPYFDILVPEKERPDLFKKKIEEELLEFNVHDAEVIYGKPAKYFHVKDLPWIRVYFKTSFERKKALTYCINCDVCKTYTAENCKSGRAHIPKYKTGSDDESNFKNVIFRINHIAACYWNLLKDYEVVNVPWITNPNISYTFRASFKSIKKLEEAMPSIKISENPTLLKDKSIVANWDIETSTNDPRGDKPPDPMDLKNNECFMCSINFAFHTEKKPFLTVCITTLPCPVVPDCLLIRVQNQKDLVEAQSLVLGNILPDFEISFNGGQYDDPFRINIMQTGGIETEYIRNTSAISPDTEVGKYSIYPKLKAYNSIKTRQISGVHHDKIKIEADRQHDVLVYRLPGCVPFDIRPIFMKLYPKANKSSLNFYLEMNKIPLKEDMAYTYMFKIQKAAKILVEKWKLQNYERIMEKLLELKQNEGGGYLPFTKNEVGKFSKKPYELHKANVNEVINLMRDVTKVVSYCNADAMRCHDLILKRNIIPDRRDTSAPSFTDTFDAFYRADGMKIRNMVISKGSDPKHNYIFSNINARSVGKKKFPGAYVNPPLKGLYRDTVDDKKKRRLKNSEIGGIKEIKKFMQEKFTENQIEDNDNNERNDRPCAGLDFSSLYPNVINTVNASPDRVLDHNKYPPKLLYSKKIGEYEYDLYTVEIEGTTYYCRKVDYYYKGFEPVPDQEKEDQEKNEVENHIVGYLIQHTAILEDGSIHYDPNLIGLYSELQIELGAVRGVVKKQMGYHATPFEFFETIKGSPSKENLLKTLDELEDKRKKEYEAKKKDFFKGKWLECARIRAYIEKEYDETQGYEAMLDICVFFIVYYNSKQNAVKVYMNSMYGESGNKRSAMFTPVVSGGVTTNGVKYIKAVKAFVISLGYRVLYGDTDSLYVCAPEYAFEEIDAAYAAGKISKEEYWTQMIEITMVKLDELKEKVFDYLQSITGCKFLSMAYEEVLFPFMMLGQKKYIGVQHQNIVNLEIVLPECSLERFKKSKSLFIRGLELAKRAGSGIMRDLCFEIVKDAFCIKETRTLKQIIFDVTRTIKSRFTNGYWNVSDFVRTARYKLPPTDENGKIKLSKTGKELGNQSVLTFVKRMQLLQEAAPYLNVEPPEVGERFSYVVSKKDQHKFSATGDRIARKAGEFWEYPQLIGDKKYEEYLGNPVNVDINYYFENEISGQFARFLTYHIDYIGEFTQAIYEDKALYKKADGKATKSASKELLNYWSVNFKDYEQDKHTMYHALAYNELNKFDKTISEKLGESGSSVLFTGVERLLINTDIAGYDDNLYFADSLIKEKFVAMLKENMDKDIERKMKKYSFMQEYINTNKKMAAALKKGVNLQRFQIMMFGGSKSFTAKTPGVYVVIFREQVAKIQALERKLADIVPKFLKTIIRPIKLLQDLHEINSEVLERNRDENGNVMEVEIDDYLWDNMMQKIDDESNVDADSEVTFEMWKTHCELYTAKKIIKQIQKDMEFVKSMANPGIARESLIKEALSSESFKAFLAKTQ